MRICRSLKSKIIYWPSLLALCLLALMPSIDSAQCAEPDWSKVSVANILMFYPGTVSWEFLNSDDHRLGSKEIRRVGKDCRYCHISAEGELDLRVAEIASGKATMRRSGKFFEPEAIRGKKGLITAKVQAAYDGEFLYLRVEWESNGSSFNLPGAQPGASDNDRVSLQINRSDEAFRRYGCFITCHNDLSSMPESPSAKKVSANAHYAGLKRDDVRLYAFYARDAWDKPKSSAELDKKRREGGRIQVLSAELVDGKTVPKSGWVFDDRIWDDVPALSSAGAWKLGIYSVVLKRSLKSSAGEKLSEKDVITAGLAIHDDKSSKRRHYVSMPFTIGINARSDVTASKF